MLLAAFGVQFLILFGTPIVVGFWLNRRWGLSWSLFLGGALAFVAGWVISNFFYLPGELRLLLSSIAQIGATYLILHFQLKTARTEREAVMVGVGQAGTEMILASLILVVLPLMQLMPLRDATDAELVSLAARIDDVSEEEVEPSRVDELRENIDEFWGESWFIPVIQAVQSLAMLPVQAALVVIVMGVFLHNRWTPLLGAAALHFLSRIIPLYGGFYGGAPVWMLLSLLAGGIALWFLSRVWPLIQSQNRAARQESQ